MYTYFSAFNEFQITAPAWKKLQVLLILMVSLHGKDVVWKTLKISNFFCWKNISQSVDTCHLLGKPGNLHTIIVKLRNPGTSTFGAVWDFYSHHNFGGSKRSPVCYAFSWPPQLFILSNFSFQSVGYSFSETFKNLDSMSCWGTELWTSHKLDM